MAGDTPLRGGGDTPLCGGGDTPVRGGVTGSRRELRLPPRGRITAATTHGRAARGPPHERRRVGSHRFAVAGDTPVRGGGGYAGSRWRKGIPAGVTPPAARSYHRRDDSQARRTRAAARAQPHEHSRDDSWAAARAPPHEHRRTRTAARRYGESISLRRSTGAATSAVRRRPENTQNR